MKSFSQFSEQAYIAREELIEAAVLRRGLSRVAQRGALKLGGKTAARLVPGVQQALGAYTVYDAVKRGDWTGAGLGALSMVPGPVGWAAIGAETARDFAGSGRPAAAQQTAQQPTPAPTSTTTPTTTPTAAPKASSVLAKKGGVEGTLDKSTGKWTSKKWSDAGKTRYQSMRGVEQIKKDKARLAQNQSTMQNVASQLAANPLGTTPTSSIQSAGQQYGNVAFAKRKITTPKISA